MIKYKLVQKYEKTERHKDKKTKIRKDNTQDSEGFQTNSNDLR